jgi:hypothetical protein
MIDIRNLELVESLFTVLAYGLKYLFRCILNDFENFFEIYLNNLFCHRNKNIRKFSTESLSYILKKIKLN